MTSSSGAVTSPPSARLASVSTLSGKQARSPISASCWQPAWTYSHQSCMPRSSSMHLDLLGLHSWPRFARPNREAPAAPASGSRIVHEHHTTTKQFRHGAAFAWTISRDEVASAQHPSTAPGNWNYHSFHSLAGGPTRAPEPIRSAYDLPWSLPMAKRRPPIAGGYAPADESATTLARANGQFDAKALLTALKTLKKGDFSVRLPVAESVVGAAIAEAFNDVAELLERDTQETARIGTVVGKEGRISKRANPGAATGAWAARIESINTLTRDLVQPTEEVARVIGAVAKGDLSPRIPLEHEGTPLKGEFLRIATTVNTMVDQLNRFAGEVTRVASEVGTEGKLGGQADVKGVAGTWKDLTDSVNSMAGNLTGQVRNIADVTTAVANGDLSKKITVDVKGEILQLKDTINTMVDQLRSFAAEVTRVAREVGTEGKLGGQADVKDVAGTWKDLTDSVNFMAGNLTGQVRNIADVTKAVATGDLSKKITVDVKGEILELKNTVNTMVDQLGSFASEVTRVAREVGTEGKLGGQADVKGVAGDVERPHRQRQFHGR